VEQKDTYIVTSLLKTPEAEDFPMAAEKDPPEDFPMEVEEDSPEEDPPEEEDLLEGEDHRQALKHRSLQENL